jgi:signal transduction histidine kinase
MTQKTQTPRASLREAIDSASGPAAVTNRVFALFALPAIVLLVVGNVQYFVAAPIRWIFISAVGYAVTIAVMMLFRATVLPEQGRGPKPLITSLAFITAGAARGAVIQSLGVVLEVLPEDQMLFRLISGPLFVYGALSSLAIIESSRLRHEKTLSALVAEKAELDELRGGIRERIRIQKAELLQQVQTVLNPAMEQVRTELAKSGAADLSLKLRSVVENVVRPLSHNIGTSTTAIDLGIKAVTAKSNLRATSKYKIDRISVGGLLVPELVMFATASIAISAHLLYFPNSAVYASALTLAIIYGYTKLIKVVFDRIWLSITLASLTVITLAIGSALVVNLGMLALGLDLGSTQLTQLAISETFIFMLIMTMQVIRTRRKALEQEMIEVINDLGILNSQLRQEVWLNRRKIAAVLHGSVQGALYAGAIRLAKSEEPSAQEIEQVQQDIVAAINKLEVVDGSERLVDVLDQIKDVWEGAVEIKLPTLDARTIEVLEGNAVAGACVAEVIRESVSNAVKHGQAKHIRVDLALKPNHLAEVRVSNDGEPVSNAAKAGYGSSILDEVAYDWNLESTSGETVLTARVAV